MNWGRVIRQALRLYTSSRGRKHSRHGYGGGYGRKRRSSDPVQRLLRKFLR